MSGVACSCAAAWPRLRPRRAPPSVAAGAAASPPAAASLLLRSAAPRSARRPPRPPPPRAAASVASPAASSPSAVPYEYGAALEQGLRSEQEDSLAVQPLQLGAHPALYAGATLAPRAAVRAPSPARKKPPRALSPSPLPRFCCACAPRADARRIAAQRCSTATAAARRRRFLRASCTARCSALLRRHVPPLSCFMRCPCARSAGSLTPAPRAAGAGRHARQHARCGAAARALALRRRAASYHVRG